MAYGPDPLVAFRTFVGGLDPAQPLPAVLLKGEELLLKEQACAEMARAWRVAPASFLRRKSDETGIDALLGELCAGSLLDPGHRLIRFDAARLFLATHAERLRAYLEAPAPRVTLVLVIEAGGAAAPAAASSSADAGEGDGESEGGESAVKRGGTAALEKRIAEIGAVLACDRPRDFAVPPWVRERAQKTYGKSLTQDAAQALVNRVGPNLALLDRALETLALYVGAAPAVEARDVAALVGQDRGYDTFQLVGEVAARRAPQALERVRSRLRDARDEGEFAGIVGLLAWHFRRLYRARALIDAGRARDVADALKIKIPRFAEEVVREARSAPLAAWRGKLDVLRDIDVMEKTSSQPRELLADLLVLRLIQG
ncbi:MAG: hypothetical protein HZA54_12990 [Planctomycetes bacterium]|nr:hypothetical protein [Planctomycetota bacterium]